MKKKGLKISVITAMSVMLLGTAAFAGTSYENYNTTVGRFNGNGYSSYQSKTTAGTNGYISSTKVGGSYVVDVRMNSSSGNGSWVRDLDDNESRSLPGSSKMTKNTNVRLQFSNDWNTPVAVQVSGKWKSN